MAEQYRGIKFKTILTNPEPPADYRINELRYWCRIFDEKNLAPPYPGGSYGNLSFRIRQGENQFIITGTSVELKGGLKNDCFVKVTNCSIENATVYAEGKRLPSSESMMHFSVYRQRPEINAIFHGHCNEMLKNARAVNIPETENEDAYGTTELIISVLELTKNNNFIAVKNHGFISLGKTMEEAGRIWFLYRF